MVILKNKAILNFAFNKKALYEGFFYFILYISVPASKKQPNP